MVVDKLNNKEIELDNLIFNIIDKGDREDKIRLQKLLKNRLGHLNKILNIKKKRSKNLLGLNPDDFKIRI